MRPSPKLVALAVLVAAAALLAWALAGAEDDSPRSAPAHAPSRPAQPLPAARALAGGPLLARPPRASRRPGPEPAPSVFLAPDGADAGDCSADEPCRSLDRAYRAADPGAVVQLADGSYPEQILRHDRSKAGDEDVTFAPAPGASPRIGFIRFGEWTADLGARHVTLRDLTIEGFMTQRTEDLTFDGVTIAGGFWIQGAKDVTLRGGSVGGTEGVHADVSDWSHDCCGVVAPERVLIDGVRFHDMTMKAPEDHVECLQVSGGRDVTIRNSRFQRCDQMDVNAGDHMTKLDRLLVENNVFEPSGARFGESYYSLSVRSGRNVVIRHNSSSQPWVGPDPGAPARRWLVAGNAMPGGGQWRCHDAVAYSRNLWSDETRCDPSDLNADPAFLDPAAGDYRLGDGSPAIDAADPRLAPAADLRGRRRQARPDVGAFER